MSLKKSLPLIHIIGLPGAGKATLASKLSHKFKVPVLRIGEYRGKFSPTPLGEANAWVTLFKDLSRHKWADCILETTGLNCREKFLRDALPFYQIITIKLKAQRKILYQRLRKKKRSEWERNWTFRNSYKDKYEFVRKLFKEFKNIPAEITIDTSKLKPQEVYKMVIEKLKYILITTNVKKRFNS